MTAPLSCPVCADSFAMRDYVSLARHFAEQAEMNDPRHIMWLNRYVTKTRTGVEALAVLLRGLIEEGKMPSTSRVTR